MTKSELIEKIKNYFSELGDKSCTYVFINDGDSIEVDGRFDVRELAEFILRSEK